LFSEDDFLRTKSSLAESLMVLGKTSEAIEKFLSVKNQLNE
jgi:hypothetical protein